MRCNKCVLAKTCTSVKIDWRGSDKPKILFVGQAPGSEEDLRAKCFVGPAGQLLTQAIGHYQLKPAALTNLVKCFPPGDRDPKKPEIEACKPYLIEEIERLKPEIIVLLGNIPMKALLGKTKITEHSGKFYEKDGQRYFPLLHPSYILRYPHNQSTFENHLKTLSREIHGEKVNLPKVQQISPKLAHKILSNWELCTDFTVAFDYETTGITKDNVGKVRCMGFSDSSTSFWVDAEADGFESFARRFLTSKVRKVAHNSVFERRCSYENFGIYPQFLTDDTFAMHHLLDENTSHALDVLAGKYLNAPQYDIYEPTEDFYAKVDIQKLGAYCAVDAHYTLKLFALFREKLKVDPKLYEVYKEIVMPLTKACARVEVNGCYIDMKWIRKAEDKLKRDMDFDQREFVRLAKKSLKKLGLYPNINLNSVDQVRNVFVKGLKFRMTELTEGGKASINEEAVEKFKDKHPCVKHYINWKKNKTKLNNFLEKYPKFRDINNIIHPSVNPSKVVSGRLSVSNPPLQAVDRTPIVRGMFASRYKNGKILTSDFKQLELRLIASEANEKELLSVFRDGKDPHDHTASLIYGKNFTKDERTEAKRVNFGVVYGITEFALAVQLNIPKDKAKWMIDSWYQAYPGVARYMAEKQAEVVEKGQIRSRFGRLRRLGDLSVHPFWKQEELKRMAGNFSIQSTGADLANISLIRVCTQLSKRGLKSKVIMAIHDSILVDVYPGEEDEVKDIVQFTMTDFCQSKCPWLKVKLEIDIDVQSRWEGMEWEALS